MSRVARNDTEPTQAEAAKRSAAFPFLPGEMWISQVCTFIAMPLVQSSEKGCRMP